MHPRKSLKVSLISTILLLGILYIVPGIFFKTHFMPNTYINNIDCSYLTTDEANQKIIDNLYNDNVLITSNNTSFQIKETYFDYNKLQNTSDFLKNEFKLDWVKYLFQDTNYILATNDVLDSAIENILNTWNLFDENNWIKSEDAYIAYNKDNKEYIIIPETQGNEINIDIAKETIKNIITKEEINPKIDSNEDFYLKAKINETNKELIALKENLNKELNKNLSYTLGNKFISIDKNVIAQYILYNLSDYTYSVDYESIANDYLDLLEKEFNTVGSERDFMTSTGDMVRIKGGNWGWKIDSTKTKENILNTLQNDVLFDIVWKQEADIDKTRGINDFSNYIEIDLTNQHLYMYKNGELIVESDIVTGDIADGHKTPGGIFKLSYKTKNATLRGPGYASFVYYWMPFNGGIGMHDATWRNSFGGTIYKNNGSHGCINMPLKNAKIVYENIDDTYAIICYWR